MDWQSWLRNLWRPRRGGPSPRPASPGESTAEFVSTPAVSVTAGRLQLRVGVVSTTGNVREHNEDNFYVPGRPSLTNAGGGDGLRNGAPPPSDPPSRFDLGGRGDEERNGPAGLFIVADGMGGQLAGEKASQMAVELVPRELGRRLDSAEDDEKSSVKAVREAVAAANQEIFALSHLGADYSNMGTTVVLALFRGIHAYIAGIGDSRAYRLRGSRLERLTRDHSLADALEAAGTIRADEVENHKFKHVLYLYLGSRDARDGPEDVRVVEVSRGDIFLLASDGLTGVVRDEVIAEVLLACEDPQRAAQALVNRALENKSRDNITTLVIHVV